MSDLGDAARWTITANYHHLEAANDIVQSVESVRSFFCTSLPIHGAGCAATCIRGDEISPEEAIVSILRPRSCRFWKKIVEEKPESDETINEAPRTMRK